MVVKPTRRGRKLIAANPRQKVTVQVGLIGGKALSKKLALKS